MMPPADTPSGGASVSGPLRIVPDQRAAARRVQAGDVAVIDAVDLDQRFAEELVRRRPAAVVNVQESISGRYPNGGPRVLLQAGIPLIDHVGTAILSTREGTKVAVNGGVVSRAGTAVAEGAEMTIDGVTDAMLGAADGMRVQLATFTANAMDRVEREGDVILEGAGLPDTGIDFAGREVVVVAPGYQHREQLRAIRRFIRDRRPVIIAVGEAADATLDDARAAQVIVGDVEPVREDALRAAQHVVIHAPYGGDGGLTRVEALGSAHSSVDSGLSSVDVALLMAHAGGASVIVTVGVPSQLMDYLEGGHSESAGTFLARLQAGGTVVDATALTTVYRHRFSAWTVVAFVLSGLVALGVALWATPSGRAWLSDVADAVAGWIGAGT